jgi:hypothetical protein
MVAAVSTWRPHPFHTARRRTVCVRAYEKQYNCIYEYGDYAAESGDAATAAGGGRGPGVDDIGHHQRAVLGGFSWLLVVGVWWGCRGGGVWWWTHLFEADIVLIV